MLLRMVVVCVLLAAVAGGGSAVAQRVAASSAAPSDLFVTSDECIACHSNLTTHTGVDVSIGYTWRAGMMANAARDPYWHAAVRREVMDHPLAQAAIEDKCSTCHMPMARFEAAQRGEPGAVFANLGGDGVPANPLAMDGVSCTVCHQITDHNFGEPGSFTGGFLVDTARATGERVIFGSHDVDAGRQRIMHSASQFLPSQSSHLLESEMCATCHTLYTHALNEAGEEVGELPEQVPYLEWLHSDYRDTHSCQSCHMPELDQDTPISSVLGQPRPGFSQHVFRGGNVFMLSMLNRYRSELGVVALPQEMDALIRRTRAFLETEAARVAIESASLSGTALELDISVENLGGHKLPTAYPSRRVWLHVVVTDAGGGVLFESGALRADGSIIGNVNDEDPLRFEPHYRQIERADQVQIYEVMMVDTRDQVTTGLLSGVRYIKDNRLLPTGFDKTTAHDDVAVHGAARDDPDFTGGRDRVAYRIDVPPAAGELRVGVQLKFQTISYRWADNLRAYDAFETNRFVRYYDSMADSSAVVLASDSAMVRAGR
jgi:hypothetical protein